MGGDMDLPEIKTSAAFAKIAELAPPLPWMLAWLDGIDYSRKQKPMPLFGER